MEKTQNNPLIAFLEKLRTEPFEVGTYDGELYPVNNGYDKKKTFVYGKGYVTLKKKHIIEPLVIGNDLVKSVLAYYEKFGSAVLLYAVGRESVNDCCNSRAISQLKSLINFPENWEQYFNDTHAINEKIKEAISEKWNVEINGEWMQVNGTPKGKDKSSFRSVLQFCPTTSLFGMVAMMPHIDWIEYEKTIDNFILRFTPRGYYKDNEELLTVMDALDNQSVSEKLEYITNKEVIKMINLMEKRAKGEVADPAQLEIGLN